MSLLLLDFYRGCSFSFGGFLICFCHMIQIYCFSCRTKGATMLGQGSYYFFLTKIGAPLNPFSYSGLPSS